MNRASEAELTRLHDAAGSVYAAIVSGGNPEAAVVKAAGDNKYNREWTGRLCEVTNRLLAVDHLESAPAEKRASDHTVVDPAAVMEQLFPTKLTTATAKAASNRESPSGRVRYSMIDTATVKVASAGYTGPVVDYAGRDIDPLGGSNTSDVLCRTLKIAATLDKADDELRTVKSAAEYRIAALLKRANQAIDGSRVNLRELEERTIARFNTDAVHVFDLLHAHGGRPKLASSRFSGTPRVFVTDPWDQEPFVHVREALFAVREEAVRVSDQERIAEIAKRASAALKTAVSDIGKASNALHVKAAKGLLDKIPGLSGLNDDDSGGGADLQQTVLSGMSPKDVDFINRIKSQQALVGALRDPVISRSNLADVVTAYNRYGDTAPRQFMHEGTLTAQLRRLLEQPDQSPHDMEQMQKLEKGLASQDDITVGAR